MNQELKYLLEQIHRRNKLNEMLNSLYVQRQELQERESELYRKRQKEQEDVDKLEGRSLAAFFHAISGKKEEVLDKERQEAYEAAVRHDAAVCELEAVEADIHKMEQELRGLQGCDERYEQAVADELENIRKTDTVYGEQIRKWEEQLVREQSRQKEISEAIEAGEDARVLAHNILTELGKAKNWSTWDMIGGGVWADVEKHSHLDEAQRRIESLRVQLRRFKTELADVEIQMGAMQVSTDGFLRFADYFFDDIFSGWKVHSGINDALSQMGALERKITDALQLLRGMQRESEENEQKIKAQLEKLAVG